MGYPLNRRTAAPAEGFEIFQRMVEEFYGVGRARSRHGGNVWAPQTDVYETESEIVIKMAVPDVSATDVRVVFNETSITISGVRNPVQEAGVVAYRQMEIPTGYFERNVAVHQPYDGESAEWQYEDGILWLRVPKCLEKTTRVFMIRLRL